MSVEGGMMAEHTPGPWAAIPPDEHSETWFIGRDRLGAPLGVIPEHIDDDRPFYIAVFGMLMKAEEAEANAVLIAAAPETKAQLDQVLIILKQAIPFVIAWANDHSGPAGDANRIGMRLASRMQIAIDNARGDGL